MGPDPMMGMMGPDPMMGMMGPDPMMGMMGPIDMGPMGPDPMMIAEFMEMDPMMVEEFMEMGPPREGEEEEIFGGPVGELWNNIFYGPGQEAQLAQAKIDFPNGWMNGGQGENISGGGSRVIEAQPGPEFLVGQSNVQDTFVFTLSEATGFGSPQNNATIITNAVSGADEILNFDPADGDKIKIMDGASALAPAEAASILSVYSAGGMHMTYITGTSGVLYSSSQPELSSILESNFTDV